MTIALVAGFATAVFLYVALDELEVLRHTGWARRVLVRTETRSRAPTIDLAGVWRRAGAGELPLRAIQVAAAITLVSFTAGLLARSLTLSLLSAAAGVAVGYAFAQRQRWTLAARVDRQLPDAMFVMSNALSAGGTLFQALETTASETPTPLGTLLGRAVGRAQLTATAEEALRALRDEVGSRDVSALVAALAIGRVTGGNLARLLRDSAQFLREEQRLRGDARALSAQARYSAQMIGAMPLVLFLLFEALFPSFVAPLTDTTPGLLIMGYCVASTAFGFYLIWRIATAIERI